MNLNKYIYNLASKYNNHKFIRFFFKRLYNKFYTIPHKNNSIKHFNIYSLEVFTLFINALNEINVEYWLMFGTLLGSIRDHNFIYGDTDIDIGVSDKYKDINIINFQLSKYGFKKIQRISYKTEMGYIFIEETYQLKNINIDIFYCNKSKDIIKCCDFVNFPNLSWESTINKFGGYIPRIITLPFKGLGEIIFLGLKVNVPINYIEFLQYHYGDNYLVKINNWDSSLSKSIDLKSDCVGYIEFFTNN
jgi:phosphorylcholine metabolism protein LicD